MREQLGLGLGVPGQCQATVPDVMDLCWEQR